MNLRNVLIFAFLLVALACVGCSDGGQALLPDQENQNAGNHDYTAQTASPLGQNLGSYQLIFDELGGTVDVQPVDRTAQKNVTQWASVFIDGYSYDPVARTWYVKVRIANQTNYTGWGCLIVFTELAGKDIVGQDGYMFISGPDGGLNRCPVVAYSKDTEQRIFEPFHTDTRTIAIHIPEGVPGLNPISFFIDAWYPGARQEPFVEDLTLNPIPEPGGYHVTAHVRDWQMPYSHQITVKGMIPFGGDPVPLTFDMFDDGLHGDGGNNDYIFGGDFHFEGPLGPYLCIVKAWDPEQHSFENDIRFFHNPPPPPCDPIPNWPIDEGPHSLIGEGTENVFYYDQPFAEWWVHLKGNEIPPPPVFWQYHQVVGITLGQRPTSGYWIRVDNICFDSLHNQVHVAYTEMIPGQSCNVDAVLTQPYIVVGMMRYMNVPVVFHKNAEVYDCNEPDCLNFEVLQSGPHSGFHDSFKQVFNDQWQFTQFWNTHMPNSPVPQIDFSQRSVVAIVAPDMPTSGFEISIDWICKNTSGGAQMWEVHHTLHVPDINCPVEQVITQPWQVVVTEKFTGLVKWTGEQQIYICPDQDCLNFEKIAEGNQSGWVEPNLKVITDHYSWYAFWNTHAPGTPTPPINWDTQMVVALAMGNQPTTGYSASLTSVCWDPNKAAWIVNYNFDSPGQNCNEDQVITQPFAYYVAEKADGPFIFEGTASVHECPPDCREFGVLVDGNHSGWHQTQLQVIGDQDSWVTFWNVHSPDSPAPEIFWPNYMVVALAMGDHPTTGYYSTLNSLCWSDDAGAWVVDFTFNIPAPSCPVEQVITQPFTYYIAQRTDGPFIFHDHSYVYPCN